MRLFHVLPLVALGTAFVIPDQNIFSSLASESSKAPSKSFVDNLPKHNEAWETTEETLGTIFKCAKNTWDDAVNTVKNDAVNIRGDFHEVFAGQSWLESADYQTDLFDEPPHHGPPHHRSHVTHPHETNMTVYELIAGSKYTTKFAKLIKEDDELVKLLNGTTANFTVFAPNDSAFDNIPEHHHKPSKEFIKKLLTYHISTDFYPAGRVLVSRTIPTALSGEHIGNESQRLSTQISFKGLTVNFYARVVVVDIFGTNGVIHAIDSILVPPPKAVDILSLLPGEFSTLELGLTRTGLLPALNDSSNHVGGTLFAPSNYAFQRLGPRINAFLFSKYGQKYLKALLEYHVVANYTLYSDAMYKGSSIEEIVEDRDQGSNYVIPRGYFHVDLPTMLDDRSLSIDVARYGRLMTIKINGFTRVAVPDGIAADGVIHVVPNVLIPPKKIGGVGVAEDGISLEEFKGRLESSVDPDGWEQDLIDEV